MTSVLGRVFSRDAENNPSIDRTDGISLEFSDCCVNLRTSNAEPLLRLTGAWQGDITAVNSHVSELKALIGGVTG